MTLLFIEGFEINSGSAQHIRFWDLQAGGTGIEATVGGHKQGLCLGGTSSSLKKGLGGNHETLVIGWNYYLTNGYSGASNNPVVLWLRDSGDADQLTMVAKKIDSAHTPLKGEVYWFEFKRGATVLGEAGPFPTNQWSHFELKVRIHATLGSIELRARAGRATTVSTVLNLSGINTAEQGTTGADIMFISNAGSSGVPRWDNIVVMNDQGITFNDFIGPSLVLGRLPDGAGATTQLTPEGGSATNFLNVDDARQTTNTTPDDINRNVGKTNGEIDLYSYADIGSVLHTGYTVLALQIQTTLAMEGSGTRSFDVQHRDSGGGTTNQGTAVATSTVFRVQSLLLEENPTLLIPWTVTSVDGSQFGVEVTA